MNQKHSTFRTEAYEFSAHTFHCVSDDLARVILDARVCFEIKQGYTMTFMFATEDVLVKWPKIVLPDSTILRDQVAKIENINPKIGLNFAFQEKGAQDIMGAS